MADPITVWTVADDAGAGKAALPRLSAGGRASREVHIDPEKLRENLSTFLTAIQPALLVARSVGEFDVDEVELSLAVNASGGIELVGKLDSGIEASIKVKLKRRSEGT